MTGFAAMPGTTTLRSVALPTEHGGWGFLLEPLLLGLLAAGSGAGLLLAVAAFGVFLIHQPLKIALKDRVKGRRPVRTVWAERFVALYGLMAVVPILLLLATMPPSFLIPIALAVPLAGIQALYDARNQSRRLLPEISGALSLAMIAPAIALLAGWQLPSAFVLGVLVAMRVVPAILYVRARLRLEHGKPGSPYPAWIAHGIGLGAVLTLAAARQTPWLAALAFLILLARARLGLSSYRKARPAKIIGFQEIAYGLITTLIVALGYRLGV